MYEKLLDRGVRFLFLHGGARESDRELYKYGLDLIYMYLLNVGVLALAGILAGRFLETLSLLFGFALIQTFGGGYHAKTHLRCFLLMLAGWGAAMLIIPFYAGSPALQYVSALSGLAAVFVFAPVEHKNFPLSAGKKEKMRRAARINGIVVCAAAALLSLLFPLSSVPATLFLSVFFSGLSIVSAVLQKYKNKKDSCHD